MLFKAIPYEFIYRSNDLTAKFDVHNNNGQRIGQLNLYDESSMLDLDRNFIYLLSLTKEKEE